MKLTAALLFTFSALMLAATPETPAETSIRKAQQEIAQHPDHAPYYNSLAMAYARRARETSDVAFYEKAEETLQQSLKIAPNNFEARKVETWLQLGRHEFAKALVLATALNKEVPDDLTVYGYLADANAELGNYPQAVEAAQWMLNLRAGNVPGLTRGAYLRELHGKLSGAMELMQMAYDSTPFEQSEDRAWLLTQMSHLALVQGDLHKAEDYANGALGLFPKYHYALGVLAQVRQVQGRNDDAVTLLQQRYDAAPHAENLFALAQAQDKSGRHDEAAKSFAEFERKALLESKLTDNANHELIAYYVDVAHKPAEALRVAEMEIARRHDVFTLDSYAWALAANGDYTRANSEEHKALAVGTKDAGILHHAEVIAARASATASR
jgi:tetratricopeptide (TPR) repeat protein